MSKTKERIFVTTGVTKAVSDGLTRPVPVGAVVTETEKEDSVYDFEKRVQGNRTVNIYSTEILKYTEYKLSIGLAITSPADFDTATPEQGEQIATGKARKEKSALLVLTSKQKYFTSGKVKAILAEELAKVTRNPEKHVKISVKTK